MASDNEYVPSQEELNVAIAEVLEESLSAKPTPKEVLQVLQKENPTWKVQERRVTKFVKKQLKSKIGESIKPVDSSEDDDASVSSTSSRLRRLSKASSSSMRKVVAAPKKGVGSVANLFRRRSSKSKSATVDPAIEPEDEPTVEKAPEGKEANLLPPMDQDETEDEPSPLKPPTPQSNIEEAPPQSNMEEAPRPSPEQVKEDPVPPASAGAAEQEPDEMPTKDENEVEVVEQVAKPEERAATTEVVTDRGGIFEDDDDGKEEKEKVVCSACVIL